MFRSVFDQPQGDIFFFTSVTKDKIIWFVVASLLYLLCFVLMLFLVFNTKHMYNRHATTNQIILSLVTEVKKKISLRMVKDWPKHVGEF